MSAEIPPLGIGDVVTTAGADGDLGNIYSLNNAFWRLVVLTAAISSAGGKALIHSLSSGLPSGSGNAVGESTAVGAFTFAGVIPVAGGIGLATTLAAGTRLLIQCTGPCPVIRAVNTTVVLGGALTLGTSLGGVQSMTTGVEPSSAVLTYLGYATNTAGASVAGAGITCILQGRM